MKIGEKEILLVFFFVQDQTYFERGKTLSLKTTFEKIYIFSQTQT